MFVQTLPSDARSLLRQLGQLSSIRRFYLAGGSAVALHLGHRVSVDLDFFTSRDEYAMEPLVQDLQSVGHLVIEQQERGTLNGTLEGTQFSFFVYPYPLLADLNTLQDVQVASLLDLALMKLISISQRGAKRDFLDLYQVCRSAYSLDDLLPRLPQKYARVSYPPYQILRSLVYFEDAESDPMPKMLIRLAWSDVKSFFKSEVRRLMKDLL